MITDGNKLLREVVGLSCICLVGFLVLAIFSYFPGDPSLNHQAAAGHVVHNAAGVLGAYLAGFLVDGFGGGAWLCPLLLGFIAILLFFPTLRPRWWRWIGVGMLSALVPLWLQLWNYKDAPQATGLLSGGFTGRLFLDFFSRTLGLYGLLLIAVCLSLIASQLITGFSYQHLALRFALWAEWLRKAAKISVQCGSQPKTNVASRSKKALPSVSEPVAESSVLAPFVLEVEEAEPVSALLAPQKTAPSPLPVPKKRPQIKAGESNLPAVDLLRAVPATRSGVAKSLLDEQSRALTSCFADFGIQGDVQGALPGPVITMFEFKPAPGIKVSRIANMSDDLALALKARAVRIVAPLPGRDTVGIEIPNEQRQTVYLREIFTGSTFAENKGQLPLALGKDIQGEPKVADLAKMPHMLVAGATGAGKSVCLNCLLLSLLYKHGPDEVKLLLVDPKRIELAVYGGLPHLVHPVVTDMHLAKNALEWAVYEMEQRYEAMARTGVRHITTYNQKLENMGDDRPEELQDLQPFPYLVIIIDELADLMMTAAKEVEGSIVRLAQLARASGIHLILATQRPSVDVVTGIIKANFPSRIAFQVSSKHDSRTILDTVGAEYLLGQGDMLFKLSGGGLQRVHGAFVDDDEIAQVVAFWEQQRPQQFALDFAEWNTAGDSSSENGGGSDVLDDPKYAEAMNFVLDQGRASISMIQRRLRIGFNRAARFIEQMEADGLIGPQEGSKPRLVRKRE